MKKHRTRKIRTIFFYAFCIVLFCYLTFFCIDRIYGHKKNAQISIDSLTVACGDIIVKETFYIMAHSNFPEYGCYPGHIGIILIDTTISFRHRDMRSLIVAESSTFNRKDKKIIPFIKMNTADKNFEYALGRILLIRTHLSENDKERLRQYSKRQIGKSYYFFSTKNDTTRFNCSTFVWNAYKNALGKDIDADAGKFVFPADIVSYFKREKYAMIRF